MEFRQLSQGNLMSFPQGSTLVTDHAELYRSLSPADLDYIKRSFLAPVDSSSFGEALWDMRNGYFEVVDGRGRRHQIEDLYYARRDLFRENLIGMAGGLPEGARDPEEERCLAEIEEERNKGLFGWAGRHKKGIAVGLGGLVAIGGGAVALYYHVAPAIKKRLEDLGASQEYQDSVKVKPQPTPDYSHLIPPCVKEGRYIEHDGIKICGPPLLQEMAVRALEKLKEKSPKDYEFVKDNTDIIEEVNYHPNAEGTARKAPKGSNARSIGINTTSLRAMLNDPSYKGGGLFALINTICHEAKHLAGYGEKEAYAKGAECAINAGYDPYK